jgi:hypothetical protein
VLMLTRRFLTMRIGVSTAPRTYLEGYIEANATFLANHGIPGAFSLLCFRQ